VIVGKQWQEQLKLNVVGCCRHLLVNIAFKTKSWHGQNEVTTYNQQMAADDESEDHTHGNRMKDHGSPQI